MIIMNGFPIGFFFPKQDFVRPLDTREELPPKVERKQVAEDVERDVEASITGFSLYAYRFV